MGNFTDEQVSLCLAALCYRGFASGTVGRFHVDTAGRAIADGLATLGPLEKQWELVWGPAVYRSPASLLDDELVYVVRRQDAPVRYAIAIRGTNPVSAFDWLFGDFWTSHQTPWPYGPSGGGALSLSTALGLAVLQRLRSSGPAGHAAALVSRAIGSRLAAVRDVLEGGVARLAAVVSPAAGLRARLVAALDGLAQRASTGQARDAEAHFRAIESVWRSKEREIVVDVLSEANRVLGPHVDVALLSLLEDDAAVRARSGGGTELLAFLAAAIAHETGPVDLLVTGHSKGGALAPTVALWLAETQGAGVPADVQWDPQSRATVRCDAFAGPTAGDAAFVRRSDAVIGARCRRFANPFDVVPHAWAQADLARIASLYAGAVPSSTALADLLDVVAGVTKPGGYSQIATATNVPSALPGYPGLDRQRTLFFDQFVHQHMDAYLRAFGLAQLGITTPTFFDPLAALPR